VPQTSSFEQAPPPCSSAHDPLPPQQALSRRWQQFHQSSSEFCLEPRLVTTDLTDIDVKTRGAYMLLWVSRKRDEPSYSVHLLRNILRYAHDEILADLLAKGHIVSAPPSGFYLTDEGVRTWAHLATECATVNNFDPLLKVWANWIMSVPELLECLAHGKAVHLARHVDAPVLKKAADKGWITIVGKYQKERTYRITAFGLSYLASLQQAA
jgi:hypothetical protein